MERMAAGIVPRVTGKAWNSASGNSTWYQNLEEIHTPDGDEEGLLHEVLHWIVASDEERALPNLGLDAWGGEDEDSGLKVEPDLRESQVVYLTVKVFSLRGWEVPQHLLKLARRRPLSLEEEREADARLAASPTSAIELAEAMDSPTSFLT